MQRNQNFLTIKQIVQWVELAKYAGAQDLLLKDLTKGYYDPATKTFYAGDGARLHIAKPMGNFSFIPAPAMRMTASYSARVNSFFEHLATADSVIYPAMTKKEYTRHDAIVKGVDGIKRPVFLMNDWAINSKFAINAVTNAFDDTIINLEFLTFDGESGGGALKVMYTVGKVRHTAYIMSYAK